MNQPNPFLPGTNGVAPGNNYTWTSPNPAGSGSGANQAVAVAAQVAVAVATQVVTRCGPSVVKALRGLRSA